MPRDEYGNVADMIGDSTATINRMCFGRFSEHFINYTTRHVERQIFDLYHQGRKEDALQLMMDFYETASPYMFKQSNEVLKTKEGWMEHLREVVEETKMLRLFIPQDSPNMGSEVVRQLDEKFPVPPTKVTYIDDQGIRRVTKKNIRIGSTYMLLLEKIGDDWGATSLPKRQHHGIPGKITDNDKSLMPWRDQAFKVNGESEVRLLVAVTGPAFTASILNFANNPAECMDAAETILTCEKPTDIRVAVDYRKYASKPGRAIQYMNHLLNISGVNIVKGKTDDEE